MRVQHREEFVLRWFKYHHPELFLLPLLFIADVSFEFKVIMENANKIRIVNTLHFCEESNAFSSKRSRQENHWFQNQPLLINLGICSGFSLKRVRNSGRLFSPEIKPLMEASLRGRSVEDEG